VTVVSSTKHSKERGPTEPGLVAFYDIRPGNGARLLFQPAARASRRRSPHGAFVIKHTSQRTAVYRSKDQLASSTVSRVKV